MRKTSRVERLLREISQGVDDYSVRAAQKERTQDAKHAADWEKQFLKIQRARQQFAEALVSLESGPRLPSGSRIQALPPEADKRWKQVSRNLSELRKLVSARASELSDMILYDIQQIQKILRKTP